MRAIEEVNERWRQKLLEREYLTKRRDVHCRRLAVAVAAEGGWG